MDRTMMHPRVTRFALPKAGNTAREYEDASKLGRRRIIKGQQWQSFAIADGATESSFARRWARLLVADYVKSPAADAQDLRKRLPSIQGQWHTEILGRDLPWYAEARVREGAYAAFLGLTVGAAGDLSRQYWHALAIGDSCLFQVREGRQVMSFPLLGSQEFSNRPLLLSSREDRNVPLWKSTTAVARRDGDWQIGDVFFLMTDALAAWFMRQLECEAEPSERLIELHRLYIIDQREARGRFKRLMSDLRSDEHLPLRNDDVTLMVVEMVEEQTGVEATE